MWEAQYINEYNEYINVEIIFGDFTSLIFELTLINFGFWSTSSAWAQPFAAGERSPAGPGLAPPLLWDLVTTYVFILDSLESA